MFHLLNINILIFKIILTFYILLIFLLKRKIKEIFLFFNFFIININILL